MKVRIKIKSIRELMKEFGGCVVASDGSGAIITEEGNVYDSGLLQYCCRELDVDFYPDDRNRRIYIDDNGWVWADNWIEWEKEIPWEKDYTNRPNLLEAVNAGKEIKIKVTPEQSEDIQTFLFNNSNVAWNDKTAKIQHINGKFLYISNSNTLEYGNSLLPNVCYKNPLVYLPYTDTFKKVKPPKPKYIPYDESDLTKKFGLSLIDCIVEDSDEVLYSITVFDFSRCDTEVVFVGGSWYTFEEMFDKYTYADGTSFGKLKV